MHQIMIASLSWLVGIIAAAVALRGISAPRTAAVLLIIAGISFGIDHPMPTGTIGMLALFAANVVLYRCGMLTTTQRTLRTSNFVSQVGSQSH
jgi:hypothetical protein